MNTNEMFCVCSATSLLDQVYVCNAWSLYSLPDMCVMMHSFITGCLVVHWATLSLSHHCFLVDYHCGMVACAIGTTVLVAVVVLFGL